MNKWYDVALGIVVAISIFAACAGIFAYYVSQGLR